LIVLILISHKKLEVAYNRNFNSELKKSDSELAFTFLHRLEGWYDWRRTGFGYQTLDLAGFYQYSTGEIHVSISIQGMNGENYKPSDQKDKGSRLRLLPELWDVK